jgi:hypothetical protein
VESRSQARAADHTIRRRLPTAVRGVPSRRNPELATLRAEDRGSPLKRDRAADEPDIRIVHVSRMPLIYRTLVLGLVPQPQVSVPSLGREELQRAYFDVTKGHPYQQFVMGGDGAQFVNAPDDVVTVQPGLIQVSTPVSTKERTRTKVVEIATAVAERARMRAFVQCGIKVVATFPVPGGGDAREFMATLMGGNDRAKVLGEEFFDAGVKYRELPVEGAEPREQVLLIEPFVSSMTDLWISYDVQRLRAVEDLAMVAEWLDDAFSFMDDRAVEIVEGST